MYYVLCVETIRCGSGRSSNTRRTFDDCEKRAVPPYRCQDGGILSTLKKPGRLI